VTVICLDYAGTLNRIATATSVIRTRQEDKVRLERRGGTPAELRQRINAVAKRLEHEAEELQKIMEQLG
jgi:hypothetical protein